MLQISDLKVLSSVGAMGEELDAENQLLHRSLDGWDLHHTNQKQRLWIMHVGVLVSPHKE